MRTRSRYAWSSAHSAAFIGFALGTTSWSGNASACAACGCGDPTLVAAGTEQPFAGRLRATLEFRHRTDKIGQQGVDEIGIAESRTTLSLAWAPVSSWFLLANAPFVQRSVRDVTLREYETYGLGDAEARAKWYFFRDRKLAPRVLAAASGGLKLPTAPFRNGGDGEPLPLEAQAGTGSWDALLGASIALFSGAWSTYGSAELAVPFATHTDERPGLTTRVTLAGQYQLIPTLALRPLLEGRFESRSRVAGELDENAGGSVLFAGGDMLWSPILDLTLSAGARAPIVDALNGQHEEGAVLTAAVMLDL